MIKKQAKLIILQQKLDKEERAKQWKDRMLQMEAEGTNKGPKAREMIHKQTNKYDTILNERRTKNK